MGEVKESTGNTFRFQDLEVWKKGVEIGNRLFDLAEGLEKKRLYRFAEQLRAAGLSIANNIAEGSGSYSRRELTQFLNIARRSTFENASMVMMFEKRGLITAQDRDALLKDLDQECRMLAGFVRSLREKPATSPHAPQP